MIRAGDGFGFAFKTLLAHRIRGELRWKNLIVTLRSSRVSRARYLAHPACTERGGDLIGTEMHPGSESHKWP
jgi:hypothetical protein